MPVDGASSQDGAHVAQWTPEQVAAIAAHLGIAVNDVCAEHLAAFTPDQVAKFHDS